MEVGPGPDDPIVGMARQSTKITVHNHDGYFVNLREYGLQVAAYEGADPTTNTEENSNDADIKGHVSSELGLYHASCGSNSVNSIRRKPRFLDTPFLGLPVTRMLQERPLTTLTKQACATSDPSTFAEGVCKQAIARPLNSKQFPSGTIELFQAADFLDCPDLAIMVSFDILAHMTEVNLREVAWFMEEQLSSLFEIARVPQKPEKPAPAPVKAPTRVLRFMPTRKAVGSYGYCNNFLSNDFLGYANAEESTESADVSPPTKKDEDTPPIPVPSPPRPPVPLFLRLVTPQGQSSYFPPSCLTTTDDDIKQTTDKPQSVKVGNGNERSAPARFDWAFFGSRVLQLLSVPRFVDPDMLLHLLLTSNLYKRYCNKELPQLMPCIRAMYVQAVQERHKLVDELVNSLRYDISGVATYPGDLALVDDLEVAPGSCFDLHWPHLKVLLVLFPFASIRRV